MYESGLNETKVENFYTMFPYKFQVQALHIHGYQSCEDISLKVLHLSHPLNFVEIPPTSVENSTMDNQCYYDLRKSEVFRAKIFEAMNQERLFVYG